MKKTKQMQNTKQQYEMNKMDKTDKWNKCNILMNRTNER